MDIDELVADTFAAHEHLAPNEDAVMSAVQQRIGRRQRAFGRPLAVAASVTVVIAAAGTAVLVSHQHSNDAAPVQRAAGGSHRPTAAPPAQPAAPHRARSGAAHLAPAGIPPLTMPYDLGWLPAGSVAYLARRINVGGVSDTSRPSFDGEYMLTVTTSTGPIDIDVQQMPGGLAGMGFKSGPGASVTINGRRGLESTKSGGPGGYEVYFLDSAGGLMYVNVMPPVGATVPAARLTSVGRAVAEHVRFPGTAQVAPTFGVSHLPAGLRARAFDVSTPPGASGPGGTTTSYDIGTSADPDSAATVGTDYAGLPSGTPGRPVLGHRTRHADDHGYRTLVVLDAVHGEAVAVSGRLPLAEIYQIADGLVLPK